MKKLSRLSTYLIFIVSVVTASEASAESVSLRSGNGSVGGLDSLVHMLVGPADSEFAASFTADNFAAARTGAAAYITNPHPAWGSGLAGDGTSQWITTNSNGVSEGSTALYAIDFNLNEVASSASLELHIVVDNFLGGNLNQGVYLNGTAVSGNTAFIAGFPSETLILRDDIAPLLRLGTNTLYLNATDVGGPSGLIFRANIETTPVPIPAAIWLFATGMLGVLGFRKSLAA